MAAIPTPGRDREIERVEGDRGDLDRAVAVDLDRLRGLTQLEDLGSAHRT
jgi:hypothetical protein